MNDYRNQKTTTIQYEYDKAGNRTKHRVKSREEETETTYTYNGLHQLTASIEKRNGNTTSSITYTYDAKGNETKEADSVAGTETIYAYDVLNQLSKVTRKAGEQVELTQENWYNGEGKRIQKSEKGTTTRYFYDNGQVLYTLNKEDEKTTQNLSGISDNVIATKRYEGDDEGRLYFYNKDVKGSTSSILDDNLNGIVSYDYDDYGVTEKRGDEGFLNEICYTGGIYDDSTSLYYLNARYYDPSTGRFLSEDTYRGEPADANTWHLYVYCANNPVNYVDPSGHWFETFLDVASIGWSLYDLATKPSWMAVGNLAWDVGATFLPFIPGSYTAKGLSQAKRAGKITRQTKKTRRIIKSAKMSKATRITVKVANKASDLRYGSKCMTIGTYHGIRKMYGGISNIETHHIIEKRFYKVFGYTESKAKRMFASIPIDKALHRKITNEWRKVMPYGKKYGPSSIYRLEAACKHVYRDMPELRRIALEFIERNK